MKQLIIDPLDDMDVKTAPPSENQPPQYAPIAPVAVECHGPHRCDPHERRRRRRQIFRRITAGVLIILCFHLISHLIRVGLREYFAAIKLRNEQPIPEFPIPPDVIVDECKDWEDLPHKHIHKHSHLHSLGRPRWPHREPYAAYTSFELPVTLDTLFMLSRGAAAGSLVVTQSPKLKDTVEVVIVALYRQESAIDYIKACTVDRGEGEKGVGIFAPRTFPRAHVFFETTVFLPAAGEGSSSVLDIKNFETNLPLFHHEIQDLKDTVRFGAINLKTDIALIRAQSLLADVGRIETSNNLIEGTFNVSSSLQLITSNGHIKVNVGMTNDVEGGPTCLIMRNSNGPLDATLSLAASGRTTGGKFKVDATTSIGPLHADFATAPVDSELVLNARTSIAPARVSLHKTYEGTFRLQSSLKTPDVLQHASNDEDPTGRGRRRTVVERRVGRSQVEGSVSWSEEGRNRGSVGVVSSLSPVTLEL